jgi:trimeric autotransporter adhesin
VSNGAATLALTSLPVGSQSITATYSGSSDFISSSSNAVIEIVLSPDFTITSTPSSQSVLPLQSVHYNLSVTPVNSTFVYPVTFTANGLPPGVTASFNPSTIAVGSAASATTLTLTAGNEALMHKNREPFGIPGSTALALLILVFGRRARRAASSLSRAGRLLIALIALATVGTLSACGGGGFFSHSTKTYTVTVTATSGPNTHTTSVNVTVQ